MKTIDGLPAVPIYYFEEMIDEILTDSIILETLCVGGTRID